MNIRPVAHHDRDAWLRMRAALWPEESEGELADEIDQFLSESQSAPSSLSAVFVCEDPAGRLTGFIELFLRNYAEGCVGITPYIEGWYVDPDSRNQGVGRALMDAAQIWARTQGFVEIGSDTAIGNELSQNAHRGNGFEEVERIVIFRKSL
jgi:aminoglycoside 6'-N-acetyltransferase I